MGAGTFNLLRVAFCKAGCNYAVINCMVILKLVLYFFSTPLVLCSASKKQDHYNTTFMGHFRVHFEQFTYQFIAN